MILLRWLAASTRRLLIAAAVCFGALFATAFPIAAYIRDTSTSLVLDTAMQTSWLLALLLGSALLAIVVADRVFPFHWRRRVILGELIDPSDDDADAEPVVLQSHVLGFSLILVGIMAVSGLGLDLVTGGFLAEYQRVGYMHTLRRSDNTELKLELIGELGDVRRQQRVRDGVEVLDLMWRDVTRQPEEVRRMAVVVLGRQALALNSSVRAWSKQGVRDHWELELVRRLRRQTGPDLRAAWTNATPPLRASISLALGKLGDRDSVAFLAEAIRGGVEPGDGGPWRATVAGLGVARDPAALEALIDVAPRVTDPDDFRTLAWAVGELSRHYLPESDKAIDALFPRLVDTFVALSSGGTFTRRCEAIDVLRKTGDARIATPLTAIFDTPDADGNCESAYVQIDEKAPELAVAAEPLRMRIIRALALVALGDDELLDWLRKRQSDDRYTEFVQQKVREAVVLIEAKTP